MAKFITTDVSLSGKSCPKLSVKIQTFFINSITREVKRQSVQCWKALETIDPL